MTPFLKFDGDIVNLVSGAHYACVTKAQLSPSSLSEDSRKFAPVFQTLQSKISQNSDIYIPFVFSNTALYPAQEPVTARNVEASDFTGALWEADVMGTLLQAGAFMGSFGDLERADGLGFFSKGMINPVAWIFKLYTSGWQGIPVAAQVLKPFVHVYAARDPQTRDVSLFILNESSEYYWFNISLDGKGDDLVVDAGLDSHFRFEVPNQGIVSLHVKPGHLPADATIYTAKMAKAGQGPSVLTFKP